MHTKFVVYLKGLGEQHQYHLHLLLMKQIQLHSQVVKLLLEQLQVQEDISLHMVEMMQHRISITKEIQNLLQQKLSQDKLQVQLEH